MRLSYWSSGDVNFSGGWDAALNAEETRLLMDVETWPSWPLFRRDSWNAEIALDAFGREYKHLLGHVSCLRTQTLLRTFGRECPHILLRLNLRFASQIKAIKNGFEFYAIIREPTNKLGVLNCHSFLIVLFLKRVLCGTFRVLGSSEEPKAFFLSWLSFCVFKIRQMKGITFDLLEVTINIAT